MLTEGLNRKCFIWSRSCKQKGRESWHSMTKSPATHKANIKNFHFDCMKSFHCQSYLYVMCGIRLPQTATLQSVLLERLQTGKLMLLKPHDEQTCYCVLVMIALIMCCSCFKINLLKWDHITWSFTLFILRTFFFIMCSIFQGKNIILYLLICFFRKRFAIMKISWHEKVVYKVQFWSDVHIR